jgi:hypothetical protein
MKNINHKSIEDIQNFYSSINSKKNVVKEKNTIFREFKKCNDKFIATNKFFVSEEIDEGKFQFSGFDINKKIRDNQKIIPYPENNDIYISINNLNKDYIDLILISNISFNLDDINIFNTEIIKKCIENDGEINDKIFEDIYYNNEFSKKINLELPKKYGNKKIILENIEVNKKYLFKINFMELNKNSIFENNRLISI